MLSSALWLVLPWLLRFDGEEHVVALKHRLIAVPDSRQEFTCVNLLIVTALYLLFNPEPVGFSFQHAALGSDRWQANYLLFSVLHGCGLHHWWAGNNFNILSNELGDWLYLHPDRAWLNLVDGIHLHLWIPSHFSMG